jgi:hypothetical protein
MVVDFESYLNILRNLLERQPHKWTRSIDHQLEQASSRQTLGVL